MQPPNRFSVAVMPVRFEIVDATHIKLTVINGGVPILLTGTPQLTASGGGLPTSATLAGGTEVTLTYPAPITTPALCRLPPNDPAIRTKFGQFIAPIFVLADQIPFPPPNPPTVVWTINTNTLGVLDIIISTGGATWVQAANAPFHNDTTNESPTSVTIAGDHFTVTFPTPVTTGDLISFPGPPNVVVNSNAAQPAAQVLPSP